MADRGAAEGAVGRVCAHTHVPRVALTGCRPTLRLRCQASPRCLRSCSCREAGAPSWRRGRSRAGATARVGACDPGGTTGTGRWETHIMWCMCVVAMRALGLTRRQARGASHHILAPHMPDPCTRHSPQGGSLRGEGARGPRGVRPARLPAGARPGRGAGGRAGVCVCACACVCVCVWVCVCVRV
jgi:hypothetical protein